MTYNISKEKMTQFSGTTCIFNHVDDDDDIENKLNKVYHDVSFLFSKELEHEDKKWRSSA